MANVKFDDAAFLKNPDEWPMWPLCPVKSTTRRKPGNWPVTGIVVDGETTVRLSLCPFKGWTPGEWDTCEKMEYSTIEELVADGWIVD